MYVNAVNRKNEDINGERHYCTHVIRPQGIITTSQNHRIHSGLALKKKKVRS